MSSAGASSSARKTTRARPWSTARTSSRSCPRRTSREELSYPLVQDLADDLPVDLPAQFLHHDAHERPEGSLAPLFYERLALLHDPVADRPHIVYLDRHDSQGVGRAGDVPHIVLEHPGKQLRYGLLREGALGHRQEHLLDALDVYPRCVVPRLLELGEHVHVHSRNDLWRADAASEEFELVLVRAAQDGLSLVLVHAVVLDEPGHLRLRELRQVELDAFEHARVYQDGFDVRLGVHPVLAGQRSAVDRLSVRERVPGLLRHAVDARVCPVHGPRQAGPSTPFLLRDQHERILRADSELRGDVLDLGPRDAVARKFVRVEQALHPSHARVRGHLGPQALHAGLGPPEGARELRQLGREYPAACVDRGPEHPAGCAPQERREVLDAHGSLPCPSLPEDVLDLEQRQLTLDLLLDVDGHEPEVLSTLDLDPGASRHRDVDILPDGPDAPSDLLRGPQERPEPGGDRTRLLGRGHVRIRRHLHERYAEPVEPVYDLGRVLCQLPRRVLFEAHGRDAEPLTVQLQIAIRGHERRPLEAARVRPIYDDLAHEMDLVHRGHVQQGGHLEGRLDCELVRIVGGLLVRLDQARARHRLVPELKLPLGLLERGLVYLPQLALGRPEAPDNLPVMIVDQLRRAAAEQLPRGQLLVYLYAYLQAEGAVVQVRAPSCPSALQRCWSA